MKLIWPEEPPAMYLPDEERQPYPGGPTLVDPALFTVAARKKWGRGHRLSGYEVIPAQVGYDDGKVFLVRYGDARTSVFDEDGEYVGQVFGGRVFWLPNGPGVPEVDYRDFEGREGFDRAKALATSCAASAASTPKPKGDSR